MATKQTTAPETTAPESTTPVLMKYAYWPQEDMRVDAGQVIELPLSQAKALIAAGKAERADAFPGEA